MSDDAVITLADRRPRRAKPVGGGAFVRNDALSIPVSKVASHEVQWVFNTTFELDGDKTCPLHGSFLEFPFEEDEPLGNVVEHEHGVDAQFVVGSSFWALINGAALSPVPIGIGVFFQADETGAIIDLRLSVDRGKAD